jgi:hypothetical protein
MKWDKTIESWGFKWVNDYAERAVKNSNNFEISIMAFEDNEFEVAWINSMGEIKEKAITGLDNLKNLIQSIEKIVRKKK